MKALARESAEATIFWHLLNETNGEDYLTFLVYSLSVVEVKRPDSSSKGYRRLCRYSKGSRAGTSE